MDPDTVRDLIGAVRMEEAPGVFMEELRSMIEAKGLIIPFMSISEAASKIDTL